MRRGLCGVRLAGDGDPAPSDEARGLRLMLGIGVVGIWESAALQEALSGFYLVRGVFGRARRWERSGLGFPTKLVICHYSLLLGFYELSLGVCFPKGNGRPAWSMGDLSPVNSCVVCVALSRLVNIPSLRSALVVREIADSPFLRICNDDSA